MSVDEFPNIFPSLLLERKNTIKRLQLNKLEVHNIFTNLFKEGVRNILLLL